MLFKLKSLGLQYSLPDLVYMTLFFIFSYFYKILMFLKKLSSPWARGEVGVIFGNKFWLFFSEAYIPTAYILGGYTLWKLLVWVK